MTLEPAAWRTRPLCRRYALCLFDRVAMQLLDDGSGVVERHADWAFGWLADGECECFGTWSSAPLGLPQMLADLKRRGVLRIQTVASVGQIGTGIPLWDTAAYPFVNELVTHSSALWPSRVPPSAQTVAERVRGSVMRAIRRHGNFESKAAALDFIANSLQRCERRLDRELAVRPLRSAS